LSYGLTPSGLARGEIVVSYSMVRRNINVAMRYHEFVIGDYAICLINRLNAMLEAF
jgi:hypothetical protein